MNLIDTAVLSKKRREILLLIREKQRSFEEIESLLDTNSISIKIHLKKLVNSGLLVEEKGKYELSEMAIPITDNLKELLGSLVFFERDRDYWISQDLTPIPNFLKKRFEELGRFELIEHYKEDSFEIPEKILENARKSKEICIFFSFPCQEFSYFYSEISEGNSKLSLCFTEAITERLFIDNFSKTKKTLNNENSKLFYCRRNANLPILVVTDKFMAIEFFRNDGKLSNQILISSDKKAINWGKDLYRHLEENLKTAGFELEYKDFLNHVKTNSARGIKNNSKKDRQVN